MSETIVIKEGSFKGMNALEYVIWEKEDGWHGCGTGYGENNILWEGDDIGPYDTRQEVIDELSGLYE